jgi:hypothetical protein
MRRRAVCSLFATAMARRTIKICRTNSRLLNRPAYSARWQKRRARSCRPTNALRSATQLGFRTPLLEQTAGLSSLILPRASISVAPRWAFPFSADPLHRRPVGRSCVMTRSRRESSHSAFPDVCSKCCHFRPCHVCPAMFQPPCRVRRDRWCRYGFPLRAYPNARSLANIALCPGSHERRRPCCGGANARFVRASRIGRDAKA